MRRWLCLGLVVLVAGCAEPPVWTPDVPANAPAEGGRGARLVDVHVTDGQGPVAGAAVLFVWLHDPAAESGDGPLVLDLLGLRAAGGRAVGHVPTDRDVHVLVGHGSGWTEEWVGPLPATAEAQRLDVRLYARHAYPFTIEGTWQGVGVGADVWPYVQHHEWSPTLLPLDPDAATNLALQARLTSLTGTLQWENAPTGFGDLGVLVATRGQGQACAIHDERRDLAFGPAEQRFVMDAQSLSFEGCPFDFGTTFEPPIDVGPATRSHMAAPLGLPYRIEGEGHLAASHGWQPIVERFGDRRVEKHWIDPSTGDPMPAPAGGGVAAPAAALGALAAVGLALAMRRRR